MREKNLQDIITYDNENEAEATTNKSVDYVLNARELYRIFLKTGVDLRRIHKVESDGFVDSSTDIPDEIDSIVSPVTWEIVSNIEDFNVKVAGKSAKVALGSTLGHVRLLLEQVINKTSEYELIRLCSYNFV